ncbi:hypothetical protein [Saccharibacter floricola]|uniref:Phosphotransferase n=1 Tax=Saccharibacter floricola DSM 15669 TaxID=1123227 RepID=A0ABQ0NZ04_9PROT|nr:hypothetical protein [Saccharibacter floricola]GBQ06997.1 phosphotransferase [Saccharibacter floricola DSM 15669]
MLDRNAIARLIPHQGKSCLLSAVSRWDETTLTAVTDDPRDPTNPYRSHGSLPPIIGVEMAMQAAALHGALTSHEVRQGWLASMRDVHIQCSRLDEPHWGYLTMTVTQEHNAPTGMIYRFSLYAPDARELVTGSGTVMFP